MKYFLFVFDTYYAGGGGEDFEAQSDTFVEADTLTYLRKHYPPAKINLLKRAHVAHLDETGMYVVKRWVTATKYDKQGINVVKTDWVEADSTYDPLEDGWYV